VENKNPMPSDIRVELSRALEAEADYYAQLLSYATTEVEVYPCSFLRRHSIYRIEHFAPSKPVLFYVGFAPSNGAYVLTGQTENFIRLAREDGVVINSAPIAIEYAVACLTVTRSMSQLFYVISSANDLRFRPNLTGDEKTTQTAFLEKYSHLIRPPDAEKQGDAYVVTCFAVREQRVERHRLTVSATADIESVVGVIEQDLPLVYGL